MASGGAWSLVLVSMVALAVAVAMAGCLLENSLRQRRLWGGGAEDAPKA